MRRAEHVVNQPDTHPARHKAAATRWAVVAGLVFMAGVGMVLLFLLTLATRNRALYEQNFGWLVGINVAVAGVLLLVILWLAVRLALRFRRGKFGSRLLVKLAAIIGLVGFLPGLLIYTVSYQFVARSIESWFDVRVESALSAGLNLGRTTLDTLSADLSSKTRLAAEELARVPDAAALLALDRLREQLSASDIVLWSAAGQALASAGASRFDFSPERPALALLRSVRASRVLAQIEGLEEGADGSTAAAGRARIKVIALVNPTGFGFAAEPRYLQVVVPLPAALVTDALAVQVANREYQERALAREGLRRMYIGTLTLAHCSWRCSAPCCWRCCWATSWCARCWCWPKACAKWRRAIFRPKSALTSRDELAGLTRTFAHMTQDLADARAAVQPAWRRWTRRATTCRPSWTTSPPAWWCSTRRAGAERQPRRGAHPAHTAGAAHGPAAGCCARAGAVRFGRDAAVRALPGRRDAARRRVLAAVVRAQRGRHHAVRRRHHAHRARRPAAQQRAPAGVRRRVRNGLGPARPGLGRSGTSSGARDQESAHPHPALGRAPGHEARRQGAANRAGTSSTNRCAPSSTRSTP